METTEIKTTFGASVLDKYRQKGFSAGAESSQKCLDFSSVPERVLRISLPNVEVSGNAPTNWVHVKVFKNMEQMKFHQLIVFSIWEMRRVLCSLDEVLAEAKRWFLNVLESQEFMKKEERGTTGQFQFANYPTRAEDGETSDKFWELCETARGKVCASLTSYDRRNFNRSKIQVKLFPRSGVAENFVRRGVVNIRVGEINS